MGAVGLSPMIRRIKHHTVYASFLWIVFISTSPLSFAQAWIEQNSGTTKALHSISYCDTLNGFAVGDNGTILHTSDGGATWIAQSSPAGATAQLRKVICLYPNTAIILGYQFAGFTTFVMRTSNGGTTWIMKKDDIPGFQSGISFPNDQFGVVLAGTSLWRTTDEGDTWRSRSLPYPNLAAISFSDPRNGMGSGLDGTVVVTNDSGNTWWFSNHFTDAWLDRILCIDSLHAVTTGEGRAYMTTVGGSSWGGLNLPSQDRQNGVSFYGLDHGAVISPTSLTVTSDRGSSWIYSAGSNIESMCLIDSQTITITTSNGAIFRTIPPTTQPPPVMLASPLNGVTGLPLIESGPFLGFVTISWHPYPLRDLESYRFLIEFATDSTFSAGYLVGTAAYFNSEAETTTTITLPYETKIYWRISPIFQHMAPSTRPWSEVWNFTTPGLPTRTISDIQQNSLSWLLRLDTVQFTDFHNGGFSYRQASPLNAHSLVLTAQCAVPPAEFSASTPQMILYDTSGVDSGWHGILARHPSSYQLASFMSIQKGDIVTMVGTVNENHRPSCCPAGSMSEFECASVAKIGSRPVDIHPFSLHAGDIYEGAYPAGKEKFSTAEQYESMYIELHHLTVTGSSGANDGSFTAIDSAGNTVMTTDASGWFTLRNHRNPLSTYSTPVVGAMIDTLRGVLWTCGNSDHADNNWGYHIAPIYPGDLVYSKSQDAVIGGRVFDDDNRNGIQDSNEQGLAGWHLDLTGKGTSSTLSNANGEFYFAGLDSGTYTVTEPDNQHLPWAVWSPISRTFTLSLGVNDSSTANFFANYFPWCSISGRVFHDRNENGFRDSTEPWLNHVTVLLQGLTTDSAWTDSSGYYSFGHLDKGLHVVRVSTSAPWEVIPPYLQMGDSFTFNDYGQSKANENFALHHIPPRIRLKITVHDNTHYLSQDIRCGVRPGATAGIWGADGHASNFDYSEGESEVPPRDFAQSIGLFDARFMDPGGTGGYFGYGSWTDMRSFSLPLQTDVYRIAVLPGYRSGGDYPITLIWSKDSVRSAYNGSVTLNDEHGTVVDMKMQDSLVVTNSSVDELHLTAHQPKISTRYLILWNLISLPQSPIDPRPSAMFSTKSSAAFSYDPASSYKINDTLRPGIGYWLKYSRGIDSLPVTGPPQLTDTVNIQPGWNLIGALSIPIDARAIFTVPPGITSGYLFGYDGRYNVADSIRPTWGYWLKSTQNGKLILSSTAPVSADKQQPATAAWRKANTITITDALGEQQTLYFAMAERPDSAFELPPLPPEMIFDARFSSNRLLETVAPGTTQRTKITVTGAAYPISLRWELTGQALSATLLLEKRKLPLRTSGSVIVSDANSPMILELLGVPDIPTEFALGQNYPNPFNPKTEIRYQLPAGPPGIADGRSVTLKVYDLLGREVATVVNDIQPAGTYRVTWDAGGFASGVYFYRIDAVSTADRANSFTSVKKMLLIR